MRLPFNIPPFLLKRISRTRQHRKLVISLAVLIPIVSFLIFSGINQLTSNYILERHESNQKKLKEQAQKEYKELLERQRSKKPEDENETDNESREAIGKHTLHFVLVRPSTLPIREIDPLVKKLTNSKEKIFEDCDLGSDCPKNISLNYLNTFYQKEARKYELEEDFELDIKFHGPFPLDNIEKLGDIGYIWGRDAFGTVKLEDTFNEVAKQNNVPIGENDLAAFLYFDNSFTPARDAASSDSFYEHKTFRSFANDSTGKTFINVYRFDPKFSSTVTEIAAHEVLHLFGASDKYEESDSVSRICSEKGRGYLEKKPKVPQTTADIMCMYIEKKGDKFERGYMAENELVINSLTAEQIGWKVKED